jgi:hypothetical protein
MHQVLYTVCVRMFVCPLAERMEGVLQIMCMHVHILLSSSLLCAPSGNFPNVLDMHPRMFFAHTVIDTRQQWSSHLSDAHHYSTTLSLSSELYECGLTLSVSLS